MAYPLSSDVSPGQPTAADHYNSLRADALRFGQAAADAVDLAALFDHYEANLRLECLLPDGIRVPASASSPVSLIIDGVPVRTVADIDLPSASAPSGAAAEYYVFAVRSPGSSSFSLAIDTESSEYENARRIGRFYWDGAQIISGSLRTEYHEYVVNQISYASPQSCNGRLTLTSGTPVTTSDITYGTLYYTPYLGNLVSLYAPGYGWTMHSFSEMSLSFNGVAANLNHDIFIYNNAGTLVLEKQAWSSDTARNISLVWQDGYPVQYNAPHKRYLGTVRTSAANVIVDSQLRRFVWNMYNRVLRSFFFNEVSNHTYAALVWRMFNNDSKYRLEFVTGIDHPVFCGINVYIRNAGVVAVGIDSEIFPSVGYLYTSNSNTLTVKASSALAACYHTPGYHYLQALEYGSETPATLGDIAITGFIEG